MLPFSKAMELVEKGWKASRGPWGPLAYISRNWNERMESYDILKFKEKGDGMLYVPSQEDMKGLDWREA